MKPRMTTTPLIGLSFPIHILLSYYHEHPSLTRDCGSDESSLIGAWLNSIVDLSPADHEVWNHDTVLGGPVFHSRYTTASRSVSCRSCASLGRSVSCGSSAIHSRSVSDGSSVALGR